MKARVKEWAISVALFFRSNPLKMVRRLYVLDKVILLGRVFLLFVIWQFVAESHLKCFTDLWSYVLVLVIWNVLVSILLLGLHVIIYSHTTEDKWPLYPVNAICAGCASLFYALAFYYYFGRHMLIQCNPVGWAEANPSNHFICWFFAGHVFSSFETILVFGIDQKKLRTICRALSEKKEKGFI